MKWSGKLLCFVFCALCFVGCDSEKEINPEYRSKEEIQLIPQPQKLSIDSGFITINRNSIIWADSNIINEAIYLKYLIEKSSNFTIEIKYSEPSPNEKNGIHLLLFWPYRLRGGDSVKCGG